MANTLYQKNSTDPYDELRQTNSVKAIAHVACSIIEIDDVTGWNIFFIFSLTLFQNLESSNMLCSIKIGKFKTGLSLF